jgi:hypothetical protein
MGRTPMLWLALSWLFLSSVCANAIDHEVSSKSSAVDVELVKRADKYWLEDLGGKGKASRLIDHHLHVWSLTFGL